MIILFGAAVLIALLLIAALILERRDEARDAQRRESSWMPPALRTAELLLAEPRPMRIRRPVMAVAKVDRAYRVRNSVVPVELKTRNRHTVYDTDIVELSVQRLVLEGNGYGPVPDLAHVVTEHPLTKARKCHTVRLLARETTAAMVRRYQAIRDGLAHGEMTADRRRCLNCAHRLRCGR